MSGVKYAPDFEVKLTIKKVLEVGLSESGINLGASLKKGPVKVTLDQSGKIKSSAKLGRLSLAGDSRLRALGANFKFLNITFENGSDGKIIYKAAISYTGAARFQLRGTLNIDKILLENSGLLGNAYRGIKNRDQQLREALEQSGVR